MNKLILIDGHAILHRAYHALPPLTTKKGEPINAVYGFVSMLLRVVQDLKPTHIAVCFDRKEPTFRKKVYKSYQSHRPEMDDELSSQIEKAHKTVDALGIPIYSKAGYEADDIIGTIAEQSTKISNFQLPISNKNSNKKAKHQSPTTSHYSPVDEVIIVTGDKDILQLVNDKVKVYLPKRGLSDAQLYGENEVVAAFGIEPKQIIDYKALVGDPSDNYPGVKGIGPKTAEKLLNEYQSLDNIYKNLDKIEGKVKSKLEEFKDDAYMSYKLATIITDVNFDFNLEESSKWDIGSKKNIKLFEEYGFKTLTQRVKEVGAKIEKEKQGSLF